jgi:hypothetical protein
MTCDSKINLFTNIHDDESKMILTIEGVSFPLTLTSIIKVTAGSKWKIYKCTCMHIEISNNVWHFIFKQ